MVKQLNKKKNEVICSYLQANEFETREEWKKSRIM